MTLIAQIQSLAIELGHYLRDSVAPRVLPPGGDSGQVLAKSSGSDYAAGWIDPTTPKVPTGGTAGQVLSKVSSTDFDVSWITTTGGGGGGSGGADPAFIRSVSTGTTVVQTLVPVVLAQVNLLATHAYSVKFRAVVADYSNTKAIRFCIGSIAKRSVALRLAYVEKGATVPTYKLITAGDDAGITGVTFAGSALSGEGNLLTIDGEIVVINNTTLKIMCYNGDSQYDYRTVLSGAMLTVEDYGVVSAV